MHSPKVANACKSACLVVRAAVAAAGCAWDVSNGAACVHDDCKLARRCPQVQCCVKVPATHSSSPSSFQARQMLLGIKFDSSWEAQDMIRALARTGCSSAHP